MLFEGGQVLRGVCERGFEVQELGDRGEGALERDVRLVEEVLCKNTNIPLVNGRPKAHNTKGRTVYSIPEHTARNKEERLTAISRSESLLWASRRATASAAPATSRALRPQRNAPRSIAWSNTVCARTAAPRFASLTASVRTNSCIAI